MIPTTTLTLVILCMVCNPSLADAGEVSTHPGAANPYDTKVTASHAGLALQPTQSPESTTTLRTSGTSDCEDKGPTTSTVTTHVSRFVRTSSVMHGVQCPEPSINAIEPDLQEHH